MCLFNVLNVNNCSYEYRFLCLKLNIYDNDFYQCNGSIYLSLMKYECGCRWGDTWFVVGREVARRTCGPTVLTKKSGF